MQPDITAHQPLTKSPRGRLKAAAVGLITTGLVISLTSGWSLISFLKLRSDPQTHGGVAAFSRTHSLFLVVFCIATGFGMVSGLIVMFGGIQMFRVRSYVWALVASVLSLLAAPFAFWPLVAISVWALVVLVQAGARTEFARTVT
ncbi:MAG TPA: hypothetical protein VE961_12010 [Pyrinomonadaceae bacterium]|nr:hypothetical protein [Pyrinomonadaceae bacterium]